MSDPIHHMTRMCGLGRQEEGNQTKGNDLGTLGNHTYSVNNVYTPLTVELRFQHLYIGKEV